MADRAHSTGRRALLAGLGATTLMYRPVHANGVHPDADLLAMEPEFLRRHAVYRGHREAFNRVEEDLFRRIPGREDGEDTEVWIARLRVARSIAGVPALEEALSDSHDDVMEVYETIHAIRAQTLQGLCFKARVYRDAEMEPENDLIADILAIDAAMTA